MPKIDRRRRRDPEEGVGRRAAVLPRTVELMPGAWMAAVAGVNDPVTLFPDCMSRTNGQRIMRETNRQPSPAVLENLRASLTAGLRQTFAGVADQPLPMDQVNLILALRQRERERSGRQAP